MPTFEMAEAALDEPLTLPVRNLDGIMHTYTVPVCSAADLLTLTIVEKRLIQYMAGIKDTPASEDDQVRRLSERQYMDAILTAPVVDQMLSDNVGGKMMTAVMLTAQKWHLEGPDAAHEVWKQLVLGKADPTVPTPAATRGSGTQANWSTGSRNITRSPKKNNRGKAKKARAGGR